MALTITTLYIFPLVLIWLTLWIRVTSMRSALNQSIGDGGNVQLLQRIRQHGNFIEWVPLTLLLMLTSEIQGADGIFIHIGGALLVLGRIAHPFGLVPNTAGHPLRYVGNGTNILAVAILTVCLVFMALGYGPYGAPAA